MLFRSQDNGSLRETGTPNVWTDQTGGDGNFVAATQTAGAAIRYYGSNNIRSIFTRTFNVVDPPASPGATRMLFRSSPTAAVFSALDNGGPSVHGFTDFALATADPTGPPPNPPPNVGVYERTPIAANPAVAGRVAVGRIWAYISAEIGRAHV